MPESREAVRGGEYAARGDYHRTPDPAWDYYPTYLAKLDAVRRWLERAAAGDARARRRLRRRRARRRVRRRGWRSKASTRNYCVRARCAPDR